MCEAELQRDALNLSRDLIASTIEPQSLSAVRRNQNFSCFN